MSNAKVSKTLSLPLLHVHDEECGDGSCSCGCGDIAHVTVKDAEKVVESQECCEPVCGPETCG